MLQKKQKFIILAMSMCMVFLAGNSLFSQEHSNKNPSQVEQEKDVQIHINDVTIDKFVNATKSLNEIRIEYVEKIKKEKDKEEKLNLEKEAQHKMIGALEIEGFNPQSYNYVIQVIKQDPELQKEVHAKLQN